MKTNMTMTNIDRELNPLELNPSDISEYPAAIEKCERYVSSKKKNIGALKRLTQGVEDSYARAVSRQVNVVSGKHGLVEKKVFSSQDERDREVRFRCETEHDHYNGWKHRLILEEELLAEWAARYNKLRRELRLLEHDYVTTGTRIFQQHTGRSFDAGADDL